MACTAAVNN